MDVLVAVAFDCLAGAFVFWLVNVIGRFGLSQTYDNELLETEDENRNIFNVAFRVFAPVVIIALGDAPLWLMGFRLTPLDLTAILIFYWMIRAGAWFVKRRVVNTRFSMTVAQAALSIFSGWYLYRFVAKDPLGVIAPQADDVSFEFLVLFFVVVLHLLAESRVFRGDHSGDGAYERYEKDLYEIEKLCDGILPDRFSADPALRQLYYSIALIENAHRPPIVRLFERVSCKLGFGHARFGKTTGIMQVPSDVPLTDGESVAAAAEKIARIYDWFLLGGSDFAINPLSNCIRCSGANLVFYENGYSYDLDAMSQEIENELEKLYARYCGTYCVKVAKFGAAAHKFALNRASFDGGDAVQVRFAISASWRGLPAAGWFELSRKSGFACVGLVGNCFGLKIAISGASVDDVVVSLIDSGLSKAIALLFVGIDDVVIVLKQGDSALAFSETVDNDGRLLARGAAFDYDSDAFLEDPKQYLIDIVSEGDVDGPAG